MDFPQVLVLGATGRIGQVLRAVWPARGPVWQTRGQQNSADTGLNWVQFDPLTDPDALVQAAQGCVAIMCLSGVTAARAAAGGDLVDNSALAEAAIRAAAKTGAKTGTRVILASSAAVYGNQPGALAETAPLIPMSDYGRAKVEMERRSAALAGRLGVPVCALRIGNIAGVDAILGGWWPGFRLDRFADGRTPRRSYIGAVTLARVLGDLVRAPDLPGVLNIAAPGLVEMGALLEAAGLEWTAQPAPQTAIAEVALDVRCLGAFTTLSAADSQPQEMVAQWRKLETDKG